MEKSNILTLEIKTKLDFISPQLEDKSKRYGCFDGGTKLGQLNTKRIYRTYSKQKVLSVRFDYTS
ncbi:hypothetical protein A0J61_03135 [Choanephora cucurbitarum]|uniref:Uncharacterized protein n=1 Tax=Choanephora cucurbitarum TaxID=101091 RepID=A0A1C7NIJ9_9FUNG|nr:hypothetical protein A0J61_03135 [Choanephora cucurbitarum]